MEIFNKSNSRNTGKLEILASHMLISGLTPWASLCGANLPGDWALYAVSVRRLIALHSGFLWTVPRGSALAFG